MHPYSVLRETLLQSVDATLVEYTFLSGSNPTELKNSMFLATADDAYNDLWYSMMASLVFSGFSATFSSSFSPMGGGSSLGDGSLGLFFS